jgi:hypothetical protein
VVLGSAQIDLKKAISDHNISYGFTYPILSLNQKFESIC